VPDRVGAASYGRIVPCDYCGVEFDPVSTRWLCPHCHMKANCCDGAPLAPVGHEPGATVPHRRG
jgi:hypothetical protein